METLNRFIVLLIEINKRNFPLLVAIISQTLVLKKNRNTTSMAVNVLIQDAKNRCVQNTPYNKIT